MTNAIVRTGAVQIALTGLPMTAVAIAVLQKTPNAGFAADEVFKANISKEHTRRAYGRIISRFLGGCDERALGLHNITPGLAVNTSMRSPPSDISSTLLCVICRPQNLFL